MAGYTKELIVNAFMHKYEISGAISKEDLVKLRELADYHYDKVGKDTFRVHASVTPDVISIYKEWMKKNR